VKNEHPRIFVIDDDPLIASSLAGLLCLHGFRANPFRSSLKALSRSYAEAPDLLISDSVMPELSGVELAIRMRALCPHCDVLLFSERPSAVIAILGVESPYGPFHVMPKPERAEELLAVIGALRWRSLRLFWS